MKTLLIDGDVFVYQIGLSAEKPTDWGNGFWTLHADLEEAKASFTFRMEDLKKRLRADEVRIALSCRTEDGFRRHLCPTYKANRAGTRKPVIHAALREWTVEAWRAVTMPRLEADDIIGIWATEPSKDERIVVSVDKDFRGVPCDFCRLDKFGGTEQVTITKESADRFHAAQTLMGDKVDGYHGIPGVGPVKAEKILGEDKANYWPAIAEAYKDAGLSEKEALLNARMAHILRWGEYNTTTHKIQAWNPVK